MTLSAAAMSFAVAAPALAVDRVLTADRGATNTISRTRTSVTNVTTSQTAVVSNSVSTDCNSGDNSVSSALGDVKGAKITSGNSTCGSQVTNTVNKATVSVTAPTTVGTEGAGPTMDYFADRFGDNVDVAADTDVATVGNTTNTTVGNAQTSTSNTGVNSAATLLGDHVDSQVTTGVASGVNALTQDLGTLMLTVLR